MKIRDIGTILFAYGDSGALIRSYDTGVLTRVWLQLGPEKFQERYKFDWTPSAELQAKIKVQIEEDARIVAAVKGRFGK